MSITKTLPDTDTQRRVQQELDWNPRVDSTGIGVKVKNGVVTLAGFVSTYAQKLVAVEAAHQVKGVLDVVDEVEVRLQTHPRTDQEIALAVRSALTWDVFVPDDRIRSTVSAGWVTLEGTVDRWQQREDAARAVERLASVHGVINRIEVQVPKVDASRIRSEITDALARRAEREAKRLQVSVDNGVVTLKGTVDSWAEKNAVERLALYSSGVKGLVNQIVVDPYS